MFPCLGTNLTAESQKFLFPRACNTSAYITKQLTVQAALYTELQSYTEKTASNILYNSTIWILLPVTGLVIVINLSSVDGLYSHRCAKILSMSYVTFFFSSQGQMMRQIMIFLLLEHLTEKTMTWDLYHPFNHPRCCASYTFCLYHLMIHIVQWQKAATS